MTQGSHFRPVQLQRNSGPGPQALLVTPGVLASRVPMSDC